MARLIYSALMSLDGYIADAAGRFEWAAPDKVVYSTTLQAPDTARTRVERDFDPEQVRKLKEAADRDLTVGGARLAAQAIAAGLVDEYQLFVVPAVVGGGTRALPNRSA